LPSRKRYRYLLAIQNGVLTLQEFWTRSRNKQLLRKDNLNYLAHIYLSGTDQDLIFGNFIADGVKGRQISRYPETVVQGILLHRRIDWFTDTHPVVRQSLIRLRQRYRKYAGVILDVYFDHFLAANFDVYSEKPLYAFTTEAYRIIMQRKDLLPERVKLFLPHMIAHNWLLHYAHLEGVHRSLTGLSRRTTFLSGMETAAAELEAHYDLYREEFEIFFPELISYVAEQREGLKGLPA
jgi:acyl carrier protein phosphodiesterase